MSLYEKIIVLHPELVLFDFSCGIIKLRNDSDGRGDYIEIWDHPTFARPTEEQLTALEAK